MMTVSGDDLKEFIHTWPESPDGCRQVFIELLDYLQSMEDVVLHFLPRPGVTFSLRSSAGGQSERPLFAMVDVIDAEPRWLSVCFYGDQVSDPDERGDYVPGGLLGEDGICFDVETNDGDLVSYVKKRIIEAHKATSG